MEIENDPRYEKGKIYKIVCNITGEEYYGSTIKILEERLRLHKASRDCMSNKILDRGNYEMILIKNYPCNSRWELEEEEGKYIRNNKCINRNIPHRTPKEYYEKYREDNKEQISKQKKERVSCECGSIVNRDELSRHRKSKKHIKLLEEIST